MTAGSTQPAMAAPPWNPNKVLAPAPPGAATRSRSPTGAGQSGSSESTSRRGTSPPPVGPQLRTSASGRVRASNSTSSASNFPDVAADIYDPGSSSIIIEPSQEPLNVPGPDYPLDSLPRNASTQSAGQQQSPRDVPNIASSTRPQQIPVTSVTSTRPSVQTGGQVVPATRFSPAAGPVVVTMAPRSLPQASSSLSQSVVSPTNVMVSVNHSVQAVGDVRQIQTQNLNVGVVSRLDSNRQPDTILPDLLAHSQPQPTARASQTQARTVVPSTDLRVSQGHRGPEHHSRHRHHRDHRHGRSRRHSHRHMQPGEDEQWIVLAALHAAGNSFLFLAIMFIGLGVLLVVVVGVGWKCTPRGHEPLHALLSLGEFRNRRGRRRRSHHRRDGRWYGGVMYPEFQYRRPPPSYNASMQEYQSQIMAAQQTPTTPDLYDPNNLPDEDYSLPSSPPPSYRSRASTVRAGIQITFPPNQGGDFPDSRPPTYRSHPSNTLQGHGRTRPSLSRDDEEYDDATPAPADVAFTGSAVIVDTNASQNSTSIQIDPSVVSNQNVTVSVTTVSVTSQPIQVAQLAPLANLPSGGAEQAANEEGEVDAVGEDVEGDNVQTAL